MCPRHVASESVSSMTCHSRASASHCGRHTSRLTKVVLFGSCLLLQRSCHHSSLSPAWLANGRLPQGQSPPYRSAVIRRGVKKAWEDMRARPDDPTKISRLNPIAEREASAETNSPNVGEDWTDYTRYALGIDDQTEDGQAQAGGQEKRPIPAAYLDRRRALGIDFGPEFTGLALSMGGTNTMPIGTLNTGRDWKELALKLAQIVSTRRVQDVVVGYPLEVDGSEGRIAKLVRHFSQILADAILLLLGGHVAVYLWDERFSTTYAAMKLLTRPNFDGQLFKSWLDGQRGLCYNSKALLDSEAARAILEHWLEKDPVTDELNKERSERVPPSKEAAVSYLTWKKTVPKQAKKERPKEPGGTGKDWAEYDYLNPDADEVTPGEFWQQASDFQRNMDGMDNFGDKYSEYIERVRKRVEQRRREADALGVDLSKDPQVRSSEHIINNPMPGLP
mmetsp:Transcript_46359/g.110392  ORF Transcript_46359/g.110392 Transcript_46359/m.110392 type:complete len:449 (-) Transcript_46359:30-1376(-)